MEHKYYVQMKMIDCRQVEISSDKELTKAQIEKRAKDKAINDNGYYDEIMIDLVEVSKTRVIYE